MLIFLIISHFLALLLSLVSSSEVSVIAAPIHQACLHISPKTTEAANYRSIICGESNSQNSEQQALQHIGLLHFLIFSGGQIFLVEALLTRLQEARSRSHIAVWLWLWPWLWLVVFGFLVLSAGAIRFLRVLILMALRKLNLSFQLRWTPLQIITASGLMTLSLCRSEMSILALSIGWIASLAASSFAKDRADERRLAIQAGENERSLASRLNFFARMYVLLLPCLLPFAVPHPLSILTTAIAAPCLTLLAIPCGLIGFTFPILVPITDFVFRLIDLGTVAAGGFVPQGFVAMQVSEIALAAYIGLLTMIVWRQELPSLENEL